MEQFGPYTVEEIRDMLNALKDGDESRIPVLLKVYEEWEDRYTSLMDSCRKRGDMVRKLRSENESHKKALGIEDKKTPAYNTGLRSKIKSIF